MPTDLLLSRDILDPISPDRPAGADLRWTPEWDRIKEARRADDGLEAGKWVKKEQKAADWVAVRELAAAALRERSKDLQLALWLTEAEMRLDGFPGLREGLRVTRELMARFWNDGLYPSMEDGPEDRAGPFEWLNSKLVDVITAIPITARSDGGRDYSYNDLVDARGVEDAGAADGHVTLELFEAAVKATSRGSYEKFSVEFQETQQAFKDLERAVDDLFGDAAPNLSACRSAFQDIGVEVDKILEKKREAEPAPASPANDVPSAEKGNPVTVRFPLSLPEMSGAAAAPAVSWQEAETLVRSGHVDKGLARMVQLAALETTGRSRFQRRLLLAEACLASQRPRLARSILEELAEQIDKHQLENWESSETISNVWTRLYKLYKQSTDTDDQDKGRTLYERLCRLDPWQALGCEEG
jgi:type VI secretion system protein ImpA